MLDRLRMALFSNNSMPTTAAHVPAYATMPLQIPLPFSALAAMSTSASSPYQLVNDSFFPATRATFSGTSSLLVATYAALSALDNGSSNAMASPTDDDGPPGAKFYSLPQIILIALAAGFLGLMTVVGNFMAMISIKMDKQLQTISNYFLFSLAVADFAIGLISLPLNTIYLLVGYWPFGALICDTWLALDYLATTASMLHLLIISFDCFFNVMFPLTYRTWRTERVAIIMISCVWITSLTVCPPMIYAWPYIEGKRTVEEYKCYIQFFKTNIYLIFYASIVFFYIPVPIMCFLYIGIWHMTKHQKDVSPQLTYRDDVVEQEDTNKCSCSDSSAAATTASTDIAEVHPIQMIAEKEERCKESLHFKRACSQISGPPVGGGDINLHPAECSGAKLVMRKAAKKKNMQERKQDRRITKTLSAILLAFIITWTPYNVMVVIQTLATCGDVCIPTELWDFVYYMCYINSMLNPLCYAMCNASFRRTFVRILTCKWHTKKRNSPY